MTLAVRPCPVPDDHTTRLVAAATRLAGRRADLAELRAAARRFEDHGGPLIAVRVLHARDRTPDMTKRPNAGEAALGRSSWVLQR